MDIYNWDENRICFTDKYDNKFNIELRGQITIINGDSASGKTLLCSKIRDMQKDKNKLMQKYNSDNIFIFNEDNKDKLSQQRHKLVIIDRADILLSDKEEDIIDNDRYNRYLIFVRRPLNIEVSPNHLADLVRHGNEITAQYEFNVRGWC